MKRHVTRSRGTRRRVADRIRRDHHGSVLVLTDPEHQDRVQDWRRPLSADKVTVLTVGVDVADIGGVVRRLVCLGGQDLILVVLGPSALTALVKSHRALFRRLFLHLTPGGVYAVDRTVAGERPTRPLTGIDALPAGGEGGRGPGTEVTDYVESVSFDADLVVVSKHGRHAWKVRESQVERVLPAREPGTRLAVLETLPAGRVCAENIHCDYGPGPAERWPRPLEHPELVVRHYEGDLVSLGGTRLLAGGTVLPESFRYPYAPLQIHPHMRTVTPNVVALGRRAPAPVLESDVYFLDCLFSGHFGHLTTEVVSRLWGWDAARRQVPGLRALFHTNPARGRDGSLERRLFTSFGIQESDLVWSDRPVRLRSVVGASPMWHNHRRYYAHPGLRDTWARITHGLLAGAEPSSHERIFVSRGDSFSHRRGCLNRDEVEALFADRGFHVFYPEEHSLEEQAALFAGARVVAGFGGSAMGNLMHSRRLEALVILSHNAYTGRNEHLFASLLGAELHYFWQQADVAPPRVGRSRESDRSSFTVDLAGQGEDLRRVLSGV